MTILAGILLAGCPDRSISKVEPQQQGAVTKKIPVSADIDILFVIDNSASTSDKQTVFAQNFPQFVAALDAFPTGRPNLHIGVVTTTVDIGVQGFGPGCPSPAPNDNGLLVNTPRVAAGCSGPTGRFISDIKNGTGGRTTNYSGTLADTFSCIAQVGVSGCGFEADLEAMKRALDGSRPENAGFIRNGAYLAIVFLTDEDDASVKDTAIFGLGSGAAGPGDFRAQPLYAYKCDTAISASGPGSYTNCVPRTDSYLQPTASYFQFLASVKDPAQIVVAMIIGDPKPLGTNGVNIQTGMITSPFSQSLALMPSCTATINGNAAIARPGVRMADFLSNFGQNRGRSYTICQADYSQALTDIGTLLFNAVSPCLEGAIDTTDADPNNPGTQLQCTVTDVQNAGTSSETSSLIPPCQMQDPTTPTASGTRPCWWTGPDATACPTTQTHYQLNVVRTGPPATGTTVDVQCAVTPM
ncbi:MAG: hypothetical protein ACM31C_30685 [Acidobacteriota bacterium]